MSAQIGSSGFERVPPEEVGITSASVLNLLDTVRLRRISLHSLMVLRHGREAVALWWKPYSAEIPHQLYSFSKSIVSAAIGIAVGEGLLSVNDCIVSFFPKRTGVKADPRIYSVTVEHLLTMTSGACAQNEVTMSRQSDWVTWFLNTPLRYAPGERFVYNSMNTYMLAAVLRAVTGMSIVDYLMPRLFLPMGIERPVWDLCPMGIECGGWGLHLKTGDMAKFCQLCLRDGVWNGERLVPDGWLAEAGSHRVASDTDSKLDDSVHRTCGYGFHFWRNGDGASWRADGMFGQYGLMLPDKDTVIVTTAGHAEQMEILDILWEDFIPSIGVLPDNSSPGSDYDELCSIAVGLTARHTAAGLRSPALEEHLSGQSFRFPSNHCSLLPVAVRYLHRIRSLGVSQVGFEFDGDCGCLRWTEEGTEQQIPFRLDGEECRCRLHCARKEYLAVTFASWLDSSTLEIDLRFVCTAHMHRVVFAFVDGGVYCRSDEDPSVEDMLRLCFGLSKPVRSQAHWLARLVRRAMRGIRGESLPSDT